MILFERSEKFVLTYFDRSDIVGAQRETFLLRISSVVILSERSEKILCDLF